MRRFIMPVLVGLIFSSGVWGDVMAMGTSGTQASGKQKLMIGTEPSVVPPRILGELGLHDGQVALAGGALLDALPNQTVSVTNATSTDSGELAYLVASAKASKKDILSKQDFSYFANYSYIDEKHGLLTRRIGIAIRSTAAVAFEEAGFNTASLFAIAAKAERQRSRGSLSFEVLGISGNGICQLMPSPTPLTVENVFQSLQALAPIKAKLYDEKTKVIPQLIAMDVIGETNEKGLFVPDKTQPDLWDPEHLK